MAELQRNPGPRCKTVDGGADTSIPSPGRKTANRRRHGPAGSAIPPAVRRVLRPINAPPARETSIRRKPPAPHARRITPPGTLHSSAGDWSPSGNSILFARRVSPERHNSLWTVRPGGSRLREIRLRGATPCGGLISTPTTRGCIHPRWSPDGTKIIFSLITKQGGREIENVYIVNADGTGLTQVTREGNTDVTPDWGRAR